MAEKVHCTFWRLAALNGGSGGDGRRECLVFVASDRGEEPACAYFAFEPATTRDGKKCRPARVFVCIAGQDCRANFDHAICEVRPGRWG